MKKTLQSFKYAWRGLVYVAKHEQNFRIQIVLSLIVLLLTFFLQVRRAEVIVIVLLIGLVLLLEVLNTAFEKLTDLLKPRLSYQIEIIKDMTAAMVFLAGFLAVVVGVIIFTPYLVELFWR